LVPTRILEANAVINQAETTITTGQLDLAERLIAKAEKLTPSYYRISYLKGKILNQKNFEALSFFEDAIERYPCPNRIKKPYLDTIRKYERNATGKNVRSLS
jgi:hypothetical protein